MFITVEGIDGCGKTTFSRAIAEYFLDGKISHVITAEPTAKPEIKFTNSREELRFFLEDRKNHTINTIAPALAANKIVLCDRYHDSTIAYQGFGRGFPLKEIEAMSVGHIIEPSLTFLLDLDAGEARKRILSRNLLQADESMIPEFDNLEMEFHQRVRNGYLEIAGQNPSRFIVLDARLSPEELRELALLHINKRLDVKRLSCTEGDGNARII